MVKRLLGRQRWEARCIRGSATKLFRRTSTLDGKMKEGLPLALQTELRPHFIAQGTNMLEYYRGIPVHFSVPYSPLLTSYPHTLTKVSMLLVTFFVTNSV